MKSSFPLLAALMASLAMPAAAATVALDLTGPGVTGAIQLTYGATADAKYPDAYAVTGISGTFSNVGLGISDAAILSLVPLARGEPDEDNLLAPNDFSRFAVASGLPEENNGAIAYDNLYWPGGSPQSATDYPFSGGAFDIYGLLFDIEGGLTVNLWSNGVLPGGTAPDYGVAVLTPEEALDYTGGASVTAALAPVPLPASAWLLGGGLVALLGWRRRGASA